MRIKWRIVAIVAIGVTVTPEAPDWQSSVHLHRASWPTKT
jgi:hypothetical protein